MSKKNNKSNMNFNILKCYQFLQLHYLPALNLTILIDSLIKMDLLLHVNLQRVEKKAAIIVKSLHAIHLEAVLIFP